MTARRERSSEGGVAAVEMAIVAPMLAIFLIGIVDVGWMLWQRIAIQDAVQEGAVYAVFNPTDLDEANDRINVAIQENPFIDLSGAQVSVDCDEDDDVVTAEVRDYVAHALLSGLTRQLHPVTIQGDVMAGSC